MREILKKIKNITDKIAEDHISAYAAQSAFFMMLSLVPILLLLMTLVRFTPITQADIMAAAYELFPKTVSSTIISIVNEVYSQTGTAISVSLLVALWSAGKGVLAISNGLNTIRGQIETRNYIFLRLRAAFYTVLFLLAIILSLVILGFGNSISLLVNQYAPVIQYIIDFVIEIRTIVMIIVLIVFSLSIYMFLPNRRRRLRSQLPGAIFTAFGWTLASFIFSVYMDIFKGFSNMYGSLTTIVIIMLWLYFCMYVMLLGGEINDLIQQWVDNSHENG
ncbi:MAG: YihY/virulence factor BrkB family protein [Tyzzerella sp.]|nr:YihY/virulence factor BrkB family protein [Tyzzerella sp.]